MHRRRLFKLKLLACVSLLLFINGCSAKVERKNGFDLSNSIIDVSKIIAGGPPRDGIPAINNPSFISARAVDFLDDEDMVIGLVDGEKARVYPIRILIWHEIVNDNFLGLEIAVTYCPLCGTSMVFDRNVAGIKRTFGVSGLLYNSDVLLFDRQTKSLWSQLGMQAISGPSVGKKLTWLPSTISTWAAWKAIHPFSEVLSTETGFVRDYSKNAYSFYFSSPKTMFPVPKYRDELEQKEFIVGIIINGIAKAYPIEKLELKGKFTDVIAGKKVVVEYKRESKTPTFVDADGEVISSVVSYWFAWQAFYPNTLLWDFGK